MQKGLVGMLETLVGCVEQLPRFQPQSKSPLVLGDIKKLRCRYDEKNITIQQYPRYFLYGVIQKTNNFICLYASPLLIYILVFK